MSDGIPFLHDAPAERLAGQPCCEAVSPSRALPHGVRVHRHDAMLAALLCTYHGPQLNTHHLSVDAITWIEVERAQGASAHERELRAASRELRRWRPCAARRSRKHSSTCASSRTRSTPSCSSLLTTSRQPRNAQHGHRRQSTAQTAQQACSHDEQVLTRRLSALSAASRSCRRRMSWSRPSSPCTERRV